MKYLVVKEERAFDASAADPTFLEQHEPVWGTDDEDKAIEALATYAQNNPGVRYAVFERGQTVIGRNAVIVDTVEPK